MLEASRLLRFTYLTVGEIAYRAGFDDQLYFSRAFQAIPRRAPTSYRERVRGQNVHTSA
jgi:AraC family transcriptional activator of pobA